MIEKFEVNLTLSAEDRHAFIENCLSFSAALKTTNTKNNASTMALASAMIPPVRALAVTSAEQSLVFIRALNDEMDKFFRAKYPVTKFNDTWMAFSRYNSFYVRAANRLKNFNKDSLIDRYLLDEVIWTALDALLMSSGKAKLDSHRVACKEDLDFVNSFMEMIQKPLLKFITPDLTE